MEVTCDDCGSVQPATNRQCTLCGASLREEVERGERLSAIKLLFAAIVVTALVCVGPGILIRHLWFGEWSDQQFALAYLAFWVLGSVLARWYQPRDDYEFSYFDNPFTFRDDADRAHFGLGVVLFPISLVSGLWIGVFRSIFK